LSCQKKVARTVSAFRVFLAGFAPDDFLAGVRSCNRPLRVASWAMFQNEMPTGSVTSLSGIHPRDIVRPFCLPLAAPYFRRFNVPHVLQTATIRRLCAVLVWRFLLTGSDLI